MLSYIIRRSLYMIIILLMVSVVAFIIIQLPPGDYLTTLIENLRARGVQIDEEQIRSLEKQYVITARAKGVSERGLLFKYPVRLAINPIVSTIGWTRGYTPFSLEISPLLRKEKNLVVVRSLDDVRSNLQPSGKQSPKWKS